MIELLFFALFGCVLGVFTGLVPGIHVNTISLLVLMFGFSGSSELTVLVIAMGITHSFVDFIPSIVFGAPDSESFLSVLPGHRLLLKGEGLKAVQLTIAGGLFGGIGAIALAHFFMGFASGIHSFLPKAIPFILIIVLGLMLFSEKGMRKKTAALTVIVLSAIVGVSVLRLNSFENALMALIIGFFAASTLLYSINSNSQMKRQKAKKGVVSKKSVFEGSLLSIAGASTVSILPSIGPSQAAFIIRKTVGGIHTNSYLVLLGGINTANIIFSLLVVLAIGKTRTGIAAVVKQLAPMESELLLLFVGVSLIAIAFSVFATHALAKFFLERIHCLPYRKTNIAVLIGLLCLVYYFNGFYGLIVMAMSACIGLIALTEKVKRTHCMAFLMVPTILIYLGL